MPKKGNCLISVAGYGAIRVKAESVSHGMNVIASSSGQSRRGKAYYVRKVDRGAFTVGLIFSTHKGYRRVCDWLETYQRWASNPKSKPSPMRVVVPSKNFDRVGVLHSGATYGDEVGKIVYRVTLSFSGGRNPLELNPDNLSRFSLPKSNDKALPYFYPSGNQLTGSEWGWDMVSNNAFQEIPDDSPVTPTGQLPDDPWLP